MLKTIAATVQKRTKGITAISDAKLSKRCTILIKMNVTMMANTIFSNKMIINIWTLELSCKSGGVCFLVKVSAYTHKLSLTKHWQ